MCCRRSCVKTRSKLSLESNVLQEVEAIIQLLNSFVRTLSRFEFRDQQHWNQSEVTLERDNVALLIWLNQ